MKIVMLCDFFNESLEYQENLLVKYYGKHGHVVTVITSTFESVFDYYADRHDNSIPARTYVYAGAKIIKLRYRYNVLNRLRALTPIAELLERESPDLIFVHDIMPNMAEAVGYVKRHPDCRMIMDYHADFSNSGKSWMSLKILHGVMRKWFLDRARAHLSMIFPIVPAGFAFLQEIYKVPVSEMELLPLGADTDVGAKVRSDGEGKKLRQVLGVPADHKVIFTGGKLAPAKKTELLIEAVLRLSDPTITLLIAGEAALADSTYMQQLFALARGNSNIRFLGWLDSVDVYKHLDAADLAVFPASQSILWQQAISMGLPLVAGDTGHQDISYLNAHGNIVVLRRQDITGEKIADAIAAIIASPQRMAKMREGAFQVADSYLNWDKLIHKTLRFNLPGTPSGTS